MAKSNNVEFQLRVRLTDFPDGKVRHRGPGKVTFPRPQAEKFERMGLGKIVGDAAPVEVKGAA